MLDSTEDATRNVSMYNRLFVTDQNKYIFLHLLDIYGILKLGQESVTIVNTKKKQLEENETITWQEDANKN